MRRALAAAPLLAAAGCGAADFTFDLRTLSAAMGTEITAETLEAAARHASTGLQPFDIDVNGQQFPSEMVRVVELGGALAAEIPWRLLRGLPWRRTVSALVASKAPQATFVSFPPELAGATADADFSRMAISIRVPARYLEAGPDPLAPPEFWDWGETALITEWSGSAAASSVDGFASRQASAAADMRLNAGRWRFSARASARHAKAGRRSSAEFDLQRLSAARPIESLSALLRAGDFSLSPRFGEQLPLRGIAIGDDPGQASSAERAYCPPVAGFARVRSRVQVRQDGRLLHEETVPAGPFSLSGIRGLSTAGRLTVRIQGEDGSSEEFEVPYAAASRLLASGRVAWSAAAGRYWSPGSRHPAVASASAAWGLGPVTAWGSAALSSPYRSLWAGIAADAGVLGAASLEARRSFTRAGGATALSLEWRKVLPAASFEAGFSRALQKGFMDAQEALGGSGPQSTRQLLEASATVQLPAGLALTASGIERRRVHAPASRTATLQAALPLGGIHASLSVQHTRQAGRRAGTAVSLSATIPLGDAVAGPSLRLAADRGEGSRGRRSASLSGYAGGNRDVRGTLTASDGRDSRLSGQASWSAAAGEFSASAAAGPRTRSLSVSGSGSAAAWRDGVAFGQRLYDGLALVKADAIPGARLLGTGQKAGPGGWILAGGFPSYRFSDIVLDPASVPANVSVPSYSRRIAPAAGALVRVDFAAQRGTQALFELVEPSGSPVPFASAVEIEGHASSGMLADEGGLAYAASAPDSGTLRASWTRAGRRHECSARFSIRRPEGADAGFMWREKLVCTPAGGDS